VATTAGLRPQHGVRRVPESAVNVTWLGHASVLLGLDGVRLLTDPLLTRRVALLRRRVPAPPVPSGVDAILVSHVHRDHVHPRSLRLVAPGARVLAPAGAGRLLARTGAAEVVEMAEGDEAQVGPLAEVDMADLELEE